MGKYNQSIGLRTARCVFGLMLLCTMHSAMAMTPEDGWWWNSGEPGRGLNIEVQNNTVFAALFIYDDNGKSVWYSGSGTLNETNTVTINLSEFANGQCVQCGFKAADLVGTAETITIRFLTSGTAEMDWSNGTVAIQRFSFNLGDTWQQQLLGDWAVVSGSTVFPAYTGDRITFDEIEQTDTLLVKGFRTGNTNAQIRVFDAVENNTSVNGFTRSGIMQNNTATIRVFAFDFDGFNRIDGITVDLPETATEEEINQALINQGVPFVAFRIK